MSREGLGAPASQAGLSPTVEPLAGLDGSATSIPSAEEEIAALAHDLGRSMDATNVYLNEYLRLTEWQPIETAPKDGTRFLAYGSSYAELAENGDRWIVHDTDRSHVPFQTIIWWKELWYDAEIDNGDGTYRKEPKLSVSGWWPHTHAFRPTYWLPLPDAPAQAIESRRAETQGGSVEDESAVPEGNAP